jgi:hypothetical protein
MLSVVGAVVAHMGAGCYQPTLRDCTIRCNKPSECLGDQVCLDQGYCAAPNVLRCTDKGEPVIVDASAVTGDAAPDPRDAFEICLQGCTRGTCIAGVCTIDCSASGSCSNDVACPANLPCRVICGDLACNSKILCSQAASCTVDCIGTDACHDEIQCPADRPCTVTCSGVDSCEKRTKCSGSCSCDVTCSGAGSCREASECPSSSCRIGNGCTSQLAGCNTCS